jgi:peptide/nickel transport system substrate-binding protein
LTAEQLIDHAGWEKNAQGIREKNGKLFEVTMLTYKQRPELPVIAEIIQAKLVKLGIKVNIRQVEKIDDALDGEDWDLAMYSMLTAPTGDPQYFLNLFYHSKGAANINGYSSPQLDSIIKQLNRTTEIDKRKQLARQAQRIINQDIPQSFIVHPMINMGIKKKVKGFVPHSVEYYYNFSEIDLQQQ